MDKKSLNQEISELYDELADLLNDKASKKEEIRDAIYNYSKYGTKFDKHEVKNTEVSIEILDVDIENVRAQISSKLHKLEVLQD